MEILLSQRPKLFLVRDEEIEAGDYFDETPPKFSDRRYLVPASNELGQSWPIGASIMLDENRMLEELIESKAVPCWKTKADYIRWAVHEGFKQIRSEVPFITKELGRVEAMVEYLNQEERKAQFLKLVDKIDHAVKEWMDLGAHDEARRLVSNISERVRSEFSDPEYQWLRTEVTRRLERWEGLYKKE